MDCRNCNWYLCETCAQGSPLQLAFNAMFSGAGALAQGAGDLLGPGPLGLCAAPDRATLSAAEFVEEPPPFTRKAPPTTPFPESVLAEAGVSVGGAALEETKVRGDE